MIGGCVEMGRVIWMALLVLALTTASSLQFAIIDDGQTVDHVAPSHDVSQKRLSTWRRSGEYRMNAKHLTRFSPAIYYAAILTRSANLPTGLYILLAYFFYLRPFIS